MSRWVHEPVVCSAYLPAAGLMPSITRCTNAQLSPGHLHCSLHTFRHNIYNCTWPCTHSFVPNKWPYYIFARLLQFFCSAAKIAAVPKLLARACRRAFYGGPGLLAPCWACNYTAPAPSLSAGTPAQATTEEPLVCLSTYGCPILLLPVYWGGLSALRCRCAVAWQGGGKAVREDARSQASKWLWWAHAADLLWSSRRVLGLVLRQGLSNS